MGTSGPSNKASSPVRGLDVISVIANTGHVTPSGQGRVVSSQRIGDDIEPNLHTESVTSRNSGEGLALVLHSRVMAGANGESLYLDSSARHTEVNDGGSWMVRSAAARKQVRQLVHSCSDSLSESGLRNCPVSFWLKDVEAEARSIWREGKDLGVSFHGNEEDVISRMVQLEQRDARGADTGTATVPSRGLDGAQ